MSTRLVPCILRIFTLTALVCFASLCGTAAAQTTDAQSDSTPPGKTSPNSITGHVVNESGQPINNATVSLLKLNSPAPARPAPAAADGTFVFAGLEPGVYLVTASAPSYVAAASDSTNTPNEYHHVGDSVTITLVKGGVINGAVTDSEGEPVVAVRVRAQMVAGADGKAVGGAPPVERLTDDRGVYRLYGLAPGTYVVSAGGRDTGGAGGGFRGGGRGGGFGGFGGVGAGGPFGFGGGPATALYDRDAPTFAPSSTRETATEFLVSAGAEINGADIKYRGERGHAVSGIVKAAGPSKVGYSFSIVTLSSAKHAGEVVSTTTTRGAAFAFYGVADGEYELSAQTSLGGEAAISRPLRVVVNGANVGGLVVNTSPLASVTGRVALEPSAAQECKDKPQPRFEEILVSARRDAKGDAQDSTPAQFSSAAVAPGRDGSFLLDRLAPGQYHFGTSFSTRYWYVRSITLPPAPASKTTGRPQPAAATPARTIDAAREGVSLRFGSRVRDMIVTLAEGAASLRGHVAAQVGAKPAAGLFAYLVPAEKDQGDNVLRFYAAPVAADGSFALDRLAPGLYHAFVRTAGERETQDQSWLRSVEAKDERTRLRREADDVKTGLELKPCQSLVDYTLPSSTTQGAGSATLKP